MDVLAQTLPLLKILAVFAGMLAGIRFKLGLAGSITLGGFALLPLFGRSPLEWPGVALAALTDPKTLCIGVIVILILVLNGLLQKTGQTARLMDAIIPYLKNPRLRLAFFPALIGLLPMPGGAIFSAPMIGTVGDPLGVSPNDKSLLNYWFRHVWETCWPLYPGVILAAALTNIPIGVIMIHTLPVVCVCICLGWLFFLRPKVLPLKESSPAAAGPAPARPGEVLRLGLPLLTCTAGALIFETLLDAAFPGVMREMGIIIALAFAAVICAVQNKTPFKTVLSAFASRNIVSMLAVIAAIFVFKDAMQKTGVVGQLTGLAGGDAALFVAAILLPMLVGLISGITMAFVGAAFPLLLDLLAALGVSGEARTAWVILALVSGFTGIMASPLHICFIFSCQYFGVNISAVWRRLLAPSALLFATGVTLFFCYR